MIASAADECGQLRAQHVFLREKFCGFVPRSGGLPQAVYQDSFHCAALPVIYPDSKYITNCTIFQYMRGIKFNSAGGKILLTNQAK